MRLLAINNYYYRRGGAETVFLDSLRLFAEAGWDVVPLAMRHPDNLPTEWSGYFPREIEFGREYSFAEKLQGMLKITYSWEARRKTRALCRRTRPRIAHAHNIYHHLSPSVLGAAKAEGIPVVLTLHDLKIACPAYKMMTHDGVCERCRGGAIWNVVAHRCIKGSWSVSAAVFLESAVHRILGCYRHSVDRFVVPSRFYRDKFVEWGWPRERFQYVPNFIDVNRFIDSRELEPYFGYVGRLGHEKGLSTLIRAARLAGVPLRIIGAGPEEDKLRALAQELGARVEFLGFLSGDMLEAAIRGCRALVLPSEWYENAPLSLMESYARGRPVIGASIGGIPELIREGETGLTFETGNVEALAASLQRLAGESDARILEMGRNGREWMASDFSAEVHRERLLTLYRELGVVC